MPDLDKLLVILDVDETLLHTADQPLDHPADFVFGPYQVYLRPGVTDFVTQLLERFDVAVWSSASEKYVVGLVGRLLPEPDRLAFCWDRSRCTVAYDHELQERYFVKDLKKVRRKGFGLERVVIVDDSPEKSRRNYGNAIYVAPFEGQPDDAELPLLSKYLETLADEPNVRTVEKRGWRTGVSPDRSS